MTTKIAILNLGPDDILVEPVNRVDGKFADGGEPIVVKPGEAYGLTHAQVSHVYDTRFFTVKEKPKG